ncbi:Ig-like domain-containing protein, partial [Nemorincola caseinilytica]|uniref:Ig-like domain-containing protein n=1 Tax=Nemorincola caseinilytica TaxID=2054315 RepID=UPI0031EE50E5
DTPTAITGALGVCIGTTTTLSSTPAAGGTWMSVTPAIGTISSPGGVAGGISSGNTTIVFTRANGCTRSAVLTVNSLPVTPAGPIHVCLNATITLSATPGGGSWGPSGAVVSVTPAGAVTGLATGTASLTYSLGTGCTTTTVVTVDALPAAIGGGPMAVCEGATTTLTSSATPGGSWSSTNPAVGTVNPTGVVGGVSAGTTTIS